MPPEREAEGKQGVYGWKALVIVVGSGVLAAFLVMGVIVGGLRMFVGSVNPNSSESDDASDSLPGEIGDPVESLKPGQLDICSGTLPSMSRVNIQRIDDGEEYLDTDEQGGGSQRIISDECQWELVPDYNSIDSWEFDFSYKAIISNGAESSRKEGASKTFNSWEQDLSSNFSDIQEERKGDGMYVAYGDAKNGGRMTYIVLERFRSAVYQIKLDANADPSSGDPVPREAFEHEVDKIKSRITITFKARLPE